LQAQELQIPLAIRKQGPTTMTNKKKENFDGMHTDNIIYTEWGYHLPQENIVLPEGDAS
jgi:hypothetical protein